MNIVEALEKEIRQKCMKNYDLTELYQTELIQFANLELCHKDIKIVIEEDRVYSFDICYGETSIRVGFYVYERKIKIDRCSFMMVKNEWYRKRQMKQIKNRIVSALKFAMEIEIRKQIFDEKLEKKNSANK